MYSESTVSDEDRQRLRASAGQPVPKRARSLLVKFGGNAMTDSALIDRVLGLIARQQCTGRPIVLVHGGGPYIRQLLDSLGILSEFVEGHRRTDATAIRYVSMVLCGQVNGDLVTRLNRLGVRAVGISGRDAGLVTATKRNSGDGADLGFVGDVSAVDPQLVLDLLGQGYLPVVAPVSSGLDGSDFNVNADMFAGHLAAALQVEEYIVLTDVDGLYGKQGDPDSLIGELPKEQAAGLLGSVIRGGMIPKVESCTAAVAGGVPSARIINGTYPEQLQAVFAGEQFGTVITN